jgi:hypothetical protein
MLESLANPYNLNQSQIFTKIYLKHLHRLLKVFTTASFIVILLVFSIFSDFFSVKTGVTPFRMIFDLYLSQWSS